MTIYKYLPQPIKDLHATWQLLPETDKQDLNNACRCAARVALCSLCFFALLTGTAPITCTISVFVLFIDAAHLTRTAKSNRERISQCFRQHRPVFFVYNSCYQGRTYRQIYPQITPMFNPQRAYQFEICTENSQPFNSCEPRVESLDSDDEGNGV